MDSDPILETIRKLREENERLKKLLSEIAKAARGIGYEDWIARRSDDWLTEVELLLGVGGGDAP